MSIQEIVNRLIPFSIELLKCLRVPPIFIELTAIQHGNLCEKVAVILEYKVKCKDNESCTGKHKFQ